MNAEPTDPGDVTVALRVTRTEPPTPSRGSCRLARMLGTTHDDLHPSISASRDDRDARPCTVTLRPGVPTVFTGPSGSVNTTALRRVATAALDAGRTPVWAAHAGAALADRPVIDVIRGAITRRESDDAIHRAAQLAAVAGLADARALTTRPDALSTGQRARVHLAVALARAERPGRVLLIDEFASALDTVTACALARALGAWCRRRRASVALATHRLDALPMLGNAERVRFDHTHAAQHDTTPPTSTSAPAIDIRPGTIDDYRALAAHHYRMGVPANPSRVLVAVDASSGERAGVIVLAYPTLNAAWRALAWPGRYTGAEKSALALRLNAEMRCIARVVTAPEYRGLGVARRLVRAYLDAPDTPCTESVAAMGRFNPFLEHAGMTRYDLPVPLRDARLMDTLDHAGLDAWRLATPAQLDRRITSHALAPLLERELRAWARASGSTQRLAHGPTIGILNAVAHAAIGGGMSRCAYAHVHHRSAGGESPEPRDDRHSPTRPHRVTGSGAR